MAAERRRRRTQESDHCEARVLNLLLLQALHVALGEGQGVKACSAGLRGGGRQGEAGGVIKAGQVGGGSLAFFCQTPHIPVFSMLLLQKRACTRKDARTAQTRTTWGRKNCDTNWPDPPTGVAQAAVLHRVAKGILDVAARRPQVLRAVALRPQEEQEADADQGLLGGPAGGEGGCGGRGGGRFGQAGRCGPLRHGRTGTQQEPRPPCTHTLMHSATHARTHQKVALSTSYQLIWAAGLMFRVLNSSCGWGGRGRGAAEGMGRGTDAPA